MEHTFTINHKGKAVLTRTANSSWIDNWANKPKLIHKLLGNNVPLIAVGNSNGDEQMLHYTASHGGLALWVQHTDEKREDKYNTHTDKLKILTNKRIIQAIDMKNDWITIFTK